MTIYNEINLPLSPRKVIKKTIAWILGSPLGKMMNGFMILFAIPALLSGLFNAHYLEIITEGYPKNSLIKIFSNLSNPIWPIGFVSLYILLVFLYQYYYYRLYRYEFKDESATISKGVIARNTGVVHYERLQNIHANQDILDRFFGIYDVYYETAGMRSNFYSHVDGLLKNEADKLVMFLDKRVKERTSGAQQVHAPTPGEAHPTQVKQPQQTMGNIPPAISSENYKIMKSSPLIATLRGFSNSLIACIFLVIPWTALHADRDYWFNSFLFITIIAIVFSIFVGLISFVYSLVWYKNFYFNFGPEKGEIKTKVIATRQSHLYYNRIQNVYVHQNIVERIFGAYSVAVETASDAAATRLVLQEFDETSTNAIKEFLLEKAKKYRGEGL